MNINYFDEFTHDEWDDAVSLIDEATYFNSSCVIEYFSKMDNVEKNLSFLVRDNENNFVAVATMGLSNVDYMEFSFNKANCSSVACSFKLTPSQRRKLLNFTYSYIDSLAEKFNVKLIRMLKYPLTIESNNKKEVSSKYAFENIKYGFIYRVDNTLIINLNDSDVEGLFQKVNKYRRQLIRKSIKKGVVVKIFNNNSNKIELEKKLNELKLAHLKASGKITRSVETWNKMSECLENGNASLFVAYVGNEPLSYLFCGEFNYMSFGWSQVNIKELERDYSPRHILEWEAIVHYKKELFSFYEVGERFFTKQFMHNPTEKEISISEFKERYGGDLFPKINFIKFYDKNLKEKYLKKELNL
jgi:hypothetical protein